MILFFFWAYGAVAGPVIVAAWVAGGSDQDSVQRGDERPPEWGALAAEEAPSTAFADDQLELAAHTNHALSPRIAQWEDRALRQRIYPSTHLRYRRASALLAARQPTDASAVARILADHDHYPLSICRHESTHEPTRTAASVIFDCGSRRASIALGNPCTAGGIRHL